MAKRRKEPNHSTLKAEATAKIRAVAKASYEVKKNVTQDIPADVTRARTSAWLDLISPVTEWAGLRGDQLRARRELLRLQQEEALNAIAKRASPKLKVISGRPIPNKFIVPFLEQASLEELDSSLIDMWADLLVSASENFESYHTHFVSIMAQLSGRQGEIFKKIVGVDNLHDLEICQDNIRMWYGANRIRSLVYRELYEHVAKGREEIVADDIDNTLRNVLSQKGIDPVYTSFEMTLLNQAYDVETEWQNFNDDLEVDYSILEAVGLIRRVEAYFQIGEWDFQIIYYYVTDLGTHFARSCGIVSNTEADQPA